MLLLIILITGSVLGWLYIVCRCISRISEINDRLFRLVPSGFVLVMLSPLILATIVWVSRDYAFSLIYIDWRAFMDEHPAGTVLAVTGWGWIVFEVVRRQIRRIVRSRKITPKVRFLGTRNLSHREIFKNLPYPEKIIYTVAGLIPGIS